MALISSSNLKKMITLIKGYIDKKADLSTLADYVKKAGDTISGQLKSTVAKGTAPFKVASDTKVDLLNADMVDGLHDGEFTAEKIRAQITLIDDADKAVIGRNHLKYFYTPLNTSNLFPHITNSNGILWLGTQDSEHFGGQLGISSDHNIYYRFRDSEIFPPTWKQIAFTDSTVANAEKVGGYGVDNLATGHRMQIKANGGIVRIWMPYNSSSIVSLCGNGSAWKAILFINGYGKGTTDRIDARWLLRGSGAINVYVNGEVEDEACVYIENKSGAVCEISVFDFLIGTIVKEVSSIPDDAVYVDKTLALTTDTVAGALHIKQSTELGADYNTVGKTKEKLKELVGSQAKGIGDNITVSASIIANWDNDAKEYYGSNYYSMIKIGGAYEGNTFGQWLLSTYRGHEIGVVGLDNGEWTSIKWLAFKDDLVKRVFKNTASGTFSITASQYDLEIVYLNGNVSGITLATFPEVGKDVTMILYGNGAERSVFIANNGIYRTPTGEDIELTVPAGGYVEVNFLYDGTNVWVRGI